MAGEHIIGLGAYCIILLNRQITLPGLLRYFKVIHLFEGDLLVVLLGAGELANLLLLKIFQVLLVGNLACNFESVSAIFHP